VNGGGDLVRLDVLGRLDREERLPGRGRTFARTIVELAVKPTL
jgi:hypothetical protein